MRQVPVVGSKLAPSLNSPTASVRTPGPPPSRISRSPVQVAIASARPLSGDGGRRVHKFVAGSQAAPSATAWDPRDPTWSRPPQTITCRPVHTAEAWVRADNGARGSIRHLSTPESQTAPSPSNAPEFDPVAPPHTNSNRPVQTTAAASVRGDSGESGNTDQAPRTGPDPPGRGVAGPAAPAWAGPGDTLGGGTAPGCQTAGAHEAITGRHARAVRGAANHANSSET